MGGRIMASTINSDTSNGVIITPDTSGEIELQANGVTKAKVTANGLQDANGNSLRGGSFRNLIINGDMRIDQRNAGASVTPTDGLYTVDRWLFRVSQASKLTAQRVTDAPTGFDYSLKVTSSSAYSIGSGDFFECEQRIEGNNVYQLDLGTSDAKTITISFWVKSSLTGTFGGSLASVAFNRSYPFEYTISSANTWEKKTVTVALDTTGTWATDNTIGLRAQFGLGVGNNWAGTAGSWIARGTWSATGATSVVGTSGATWQITGVQVEVGEGASDFEFLPYDVQLQRCQRYYQYVSFSGTAANTGEMAVAGPFRTEMRTTPTLSIYSTSGTGTMTSEFTTHTLTRIGVGQVTVGNLTTFFLGSRGLYNIYCTGLATGGVYVGTSYVSAEL
jgi:hypothetical protein